MEKDYLFDTKQFDKIKQIGYGGFSTVFLVKNKETGSICVAKVVTDILDEDDKIQFIREVNIVSRLSHPSIIQFLGFSKTDFYGNNRPVIFTEYIQGGSLNKFISPGKLTNTKKIIILYGVASALSFMHYHKIIHRDLKPENILLDEKFYPKLADFGFSKYAHDYEGKNLLNSQRDDLKGTIHYLAPEIIEDNSYSYESDVYAFAIVTYEIMAELRASSEGVTAMKFLDEVNNGYRPTFKSNIPEAYKKLIEDCWSQNPNERPQFKQIVSNLEKDPKFRIDVENSEFDNYIKYIKQCEVFYNTGKRILTIDEFNLTQKHASDESPNFSPNMSSFSLPSLTHVDKEMAEIFNEAVTKFNENDFQSSAQLFKKVADKGLPRACYNYGIMLEKGIGVDVDKKMAIRYYKAASDAGHIESSFNHGTLIMDTEEGAKEAASRFKFAAEAGLAEAMFNYGMMKFNGVGVKEDKNEAAKYLKMAAELDLAEALRNYGLMLFKGEGVKRNKKDGLAYLKKFEEKVKIKK